MHFLTTIAGTRFTGFIEAMKFKFKCRGCKNDLSCDSVKAGEISTCPTCGTELKIPYPGIGIGIFWGYWVLLLISSAFFGQMGGLGMIMLLGVFSLNLYIKYLRVINIGLHPAWTVFGLVPWISTIWFGVVSTGSVKRH